MEESDSLVISYKAEGETDYTQINSANSTTAEKTGLSVGSKGEIKVQILGKDGTVKVEKTKKVQTGIAVESITLNKTTASLKVGEKLQLTAKVLPEDATNKEVEWTGNNANVATVDDAGKVTAKGSGEVTITATAKDGGGEKAECRITVTQPVTGVHLNQTTGSVNVGKTLKLTATVEPNLADNKNVTWSVTSGEGNVTVDQSGTVKGVKEGSATITVTTEDGNKTASCDITILPKVAVAVPAPASGQESNWTLISDIANAIKNDSKIPNYAVGPLEVDVGDNRYKVSIGNTFYVKYGSAIKRVRIIGFKHDDLEDGTGKAGITFDFVDFMTGTTFKAMNSNSTDTNKGGWEATELRKFLNGTNGIGKFSSTLKNKIKEVKKQYIKTYNSASSKTTCNDKLWLLSCGEIWGNKARAITTEGRQYTWYKNKQNGKAYNETNNNFAKKPNSNSTQNEIWWLRSPLYNGSDCFCIVMNGGDCSWEASGYTDGVAPGFCI